MKVEFQFSSVVAGVEAAQVLVIVAVLVRSLSLIV